MASSSCARISPSSATHLRMTLCVPSLALVGILLYPCGISVLYIVLFLKAKSAVLDEKPTALSKALDFLTLDFEKAWFAWELFEAWKKCVCRSSNLSASNIPTP